MTETANLSGFSANCSSALCHTSASCYATCRPCSILMWNDPPTQIASVTVALSFTLFLLFGPVAGLVFVSRHKDCFLPEASYVPAFLWKPTLRSVSQHTSEHNSLFDMCGSGSGPCYVTAALTSENVHKCDSIS